MFPSSCRRAAFRSITSARFPRTRGTSSWTLATWSQTTCPTTTRKVSSGWSMTSSGHKLISRIDPDHVTSVILIDAQHWFTPSNIWFPQLGLVLSLLSEEVDVIKVNDVVIYSNYRGETETFSCSRINKRISGDNREAAPSHSNGKMPRQR